MAGRDTGKNSRAPRNSSVLPNAYAVTKTGSAVLWIDANNASAWAVNVSDEKERNRDQERQKRNNRTGLSPCAVADQQTAADSKSDHQTPCPYRNAVTPSCLRVAAHHP